MKVLKGLLPFHLCLLMCISSQVYGQGFGAAVDEDSADEEGDTSVSKDSDPKILEEIEKLKRARADLRANLDHLRNQNGQLHHALLGSSARGCFAELEISKLEILVKGGLSPNFFSLGTHKEQKSSVGDPYSFSIQFGKDLGFSENANALFRGTEFNSEEGVVMKTDLGGRKIADIEFIKFVRNGTAYDNKERTKSCGFLGSGRCTRWEHGEHNIFILSDIKIRVNDQDLFVKSGINHMFDRNNLEFKLLEHEIEINPAFTKLMSRKDCVQSE